MKPVRVRSIGEAEVVIQSQQVSLDALEKLVRDHAQRFDTLQTPWWKRLWYKVNGWPWYDLNGIQRRRPWHRTR